MEYKTFHIFFEIYSNHRKVLLQKNRIYSKTMWLRSFFSLGKNRKTKKSVNGL